MGLVQQRMTPGRTTLLGAVNALLTNIGEQPVNNLDNEQIQDARVAQQTLLEFHKDGQTRGWSWNTEKAYPFAPDPVTGGVEVPTNAVSWAVNPQLNGRYILRAAFGLRQVDRLIRSPPDRGDVIWLPSWVESLRRTTAGQRSAPHGCSPLDAGDEALVSTRRLTSRSAERAAASGVCAGSRTH